MQSFKLCFYWKKFSTQWETFQVLFDFSDQTPCDHLLEYSPPRLLPTVHFHLKHLQTNIVSLAENLCARCIMPSNSDKDCHCFVFSLPVMLLPSGCSIKTFLCFEALQGKKEFFRSHCMRSCFIDKINNFYTFLSGVILPGRSRGVISEVNGTGHFRRQCRLKRYCHFYM